MFRNEVAEIYKHNVREQHRIEFYGQYVMIKKKQNFLLGILEKIFEKRKFIKV